MLFLPLLVSLAAAAPAPTAGPATTKTASDPWQATIEAITPAVVAIQFQSPRFFDTESAFDAVATGFVVDKERGIILTNRHVVNPGPVVAKAVFLNHEEVELTAIYRDPVHDFGFYKFDPKAVKYMDVVALPLAPEGARVGAEIRVVGNDAGEKLSILAGTLARLDRDAPDYGRDGFNDFNTFYIQAASATSGGSSGSPVIDVQGRAVALNAGGANHAASSFYLPLDRVVRALKLVQAGKPVTRGTLAVVFRHEAFDELRRLGLRAETEAAVRGRDKAETGMLVVREVVPGGPAAGKLEPGDIVVALDGKPLTAFIPMEAVFDDAAGKTTTLSIERGGKAMDVELTVRDLHALTPDNFLEVGDGILNPLSLMQARNHNVPVGGPYVAFPGFVLGNGGVPRGAWIKSVNGLPTATLDAAEAAFAALAEGELAQVRYSDVSDPLTEQVAIIEMNRKLFPMQRCRRDDTTGLWPCTASPNLAKDKAQLPATAQLPRILGKSADVASHSLVFVTCVLPFRLEGVPGDSYSGIGLVVDAAQGLVLVDRNTVPISMAQVDITVGGQVRVPARIRWLHPEHNFAIIQYDPKLLGDTDLRTAQFAGGELETNEGVYQVGLNNRLQVTWSPARIAGMRPFTLSVPNTPSFRDYNLDVGETFEAALDKGGVLVDKKGRVRAWWASFVQGWGDKFQEDWFAIPADTLADIIEPLRQGDEPDVRSLGIEWRPLTLAQARDRGLSADEAHALSGGTGTVLAASRVAPDAPAAALVRPGDMLLDANGITTNTFRGIELASRAPSVHLRVWRDGKATALDVPTRSLPTTGTTRALVWAGSVLHEVHPAVPLQRNVAPEGVYVAWSWYGSPADHFGLLGTSRILAVDDIPTPNLDTFEKVVQERQGESALRLKVVDLEGKPSVITLELDLAYWPTAELNLVNGEWVRKQI